MFSVTLTSPHGNTAGHRFPVTGYYGVTPVDMNGRLTFNIYEGGHAVPVRAVYVAIRCYEISENGRHRGKRERIVWENVRSLWQPPPGIEEEPLADGWKADFKMAIPPEVAEIARGTQYLREWRVRWRLEAVVEHAPIPYVGHRVAHAYDLIIRDHRSPIPSLPSPPSGQVIGSGATATHVHINPPPTAYGPSEHLAVSFSVRPEDPSASIKSLQIVLDRRMELFEDRRTSSSSGGRRNRVGNLFHRGNGNSSSQSSRSSSEEGANRAIVTRIAETQCEVPEPGSTGAVWSLGQLQLPRRTNHNWDMGETERTEFADISFEARLKVTLKNKRGGSPKELVSQPIPVVIVGTTAEERAAALRATERPEPGSKRRLVHCRDMYTLSHAPQSDLNHVVKTRRSESGATTPPARSSAFDSLPSPPSEDRLPPIDSFLGFGCPQPADSIYSMSDASSVRTTSTVTTLPSRDPENAYLISPVRTARRISSTSEDEDMPRSRQKVERSSEPPPSMLDSPPRRRRMALPSLDALGIGLPNRVRPSTAPTFGVYAAKPPPFGRPGSSSSNFTFVLPNGQQSMPSGQPRPT